jgi:hypothetical protein
MVFLNGKPFLTYGIDTQETRFKRIAWVLKTHPMFTRTEPKDLVDLDNDTNIVGTNLMDLIRQSAQVGDFQSFYEEIKDHYKAPFDIVLYMWLKSVPDFENSEDFLIIDIESKYPDVNVKHILNYPGNDITGKITNFLEEQDMIEKEQQEFSINIIPVDMDVIDIQKITFEVRFRLDIDLVEIFDSLKVSSELPYVNNGGDRHKIFREFKNLGSNWEFGNSSVIQFYVLNTRYPPTKFQEKAYSQGVIALTETRGEALMEIETVVGVKNNLEDLLDRVFSSLQINKRNIIETRQHSINSIVNIPQQRFNKYIMADIISNDPMVSSLCYIDESAKIGRIRSSISFFYQPVGSEEKVTISMTESAVELKEYRKNPRLYPMDTRYIKVHIKRVKTEELTNEIASFIGRIFRVYLNKKEEVVHLYNRFIPTFIELEDKLVRQYTQRGSRLQDIVPEVFIPGYARACQRPPIIIDEEVKRIISKAKGFIIEKPIPEYTQAMLFPKSPEEGPQHWYACPNGRYPGLRNNVLSNSEKFPYLPCCYPLNQTDKKNFKNYYLDYDIKDQTTSFTHILTTFKFLSKGELGTIPSNLDSLFQNLTKGKVQFYRTGSPISPSSFLDAVSIAIGKPLEKKNVTDNMFASCRQNAFSINVQQLKSEFMNSEGYLNPGIYYRALEEYFNCYIYLFTRVETQGAVLYPPHRHVLLRYKREPRPIVMILEHMGGESDAAQYPQCEAILAISSDNKISKFDGDFAIEIDRIYRNTIHWFSGLSPAEEVNKSDLFKGIVSQGIDSMGKVRTLEIKYKGNHIYVITDPLPPLTVPEKSSYLNNDPKILSDFLKEEGLDIKSITPDKYIVHKNGRIYYFPYQVIRSSLLDMYNQNQRIARYLQEYTYYMYSRYAKDNNLNPNNINSFLKENMVVKKDYIYPKITRRFDLSGPYLEEGKLIVQNLEMAQRLGYSIELMMRRDIKRLTEYCSYELIQEYYLDRNDFTSDRNAIILMTDEALRDWISKSSIEYNLYTLPTSKVETFYLSLMGRVVLVQSTESFESAVNVARIWNKSGYNAQSVAEDEESNYMYYIFESPREITAHGNHKNKVLVWREEDELKYGAILE